MTLNHDAPGGCSGYRQLARRWRKRPAWRDEILARRKRSRVVNVQSSSLPSWTPQLTFRAAGASAGNVVVCIFQRGGMDGLSALIPHGEGAGYYDRRPTLAVKAPGSGANSALNLDGFFGLHPSLTGLKELYSDGVLAAVAATGSIDPTRSHFDAMRFMEQGVPGNKSLQTGWLGRHLEMTAAADDSPVRAVGFGSLLPTSLRASPSFSALALESIESYQLEGNDSFLPDIRANLEKNYHVAKPTAPIENQARLVLQTIDLLQSLSGVDYVPANGAKYPDSGFGQALKQVAQLIKAGVGLEVACVDLGDWDTHENQGTIGGWFGENIKELGDGILALATDLGSLMNTTTVVTMSEFGRRVEENASRGTDHGHGNVMFVAGGGVRGKKVYGDWPTLKEDALDAGDVAITTDCRQVLAELVEKRLGNAAISTVFPGLSYDPLGIFG
jgi:uncharacterized protein (DUF1501 family)